MCKEKAMWFDRFDENGHAYCDNHYPKGIYYCEICKNEDVACVCMSQDEIHRKSIFDMVIETKIVVPELKQI